MPGFSLYPPRSPSCTTLAVPGPCCMTSSSCSLARVKKLAPFRSRCKSPTIASVKSSAPGSLKEGSKPEGCVGAYLLPAQAPHNCFFVEQAKDQWNRVVESKIVSLAPRTSNRVGAKTGGCIYNTVD